MNTPVIVFCYNRPANLQLTVEQLSRNLPASSTDLYVFSDAPAAPADDEKVYRVRSYLKTISGFKKVHIREAAENKGLARSVIEGVSEVLRQHESVIVLEDDLLTSGNFLSYMNQSLGYYAANKKVLSVSGYTRPVMFAPGYRFDNYFTRRLSSWGWGTWRDRWFSVDWSVGSYRDFVRDHTARRQFNAMGSDLCYMLHKQMSGKINSWAIRWCYHQFKTDTYTAFPRISKIQNIGFGATATHTSSVQRSRFATVLDLSGKDVFALDPSPALDDAVIRQFVRDYSVLTRLKYKALNLIFQ